VVQIDFDAQKIRLLKPRRSQSDETLPLQLRPCGIRVPISVNGHKRYGALDTGCATRCSGDFGRAADNARAAWPSAG